MNSKQTNNNKNKKCIKNIKKDIKEFEMVEYEEHIKPLEKEDYIEKKKDIIRKEVQAINDGEAKSNIISSVAAKAFWEVARYDAEMFRKSHPITAKYEVMKPRIHETIYENEDEQVQIVAKTNNSYLDKHSYYKPEKYKNNVITGISNFRYEKLTKTNKPIYDEVSRVLGSCAWCLEMIGRAQKEQKSFDLFSLNWNRCQCKIVSRKPIISDYRILYSSGNCVSVSRNVFSKVNGKFYQEGDIKFKIPQLEDTTLLFKDFKKKIVENFKAHVLDFSKLKELAGYASKAVDLMKFAQTKADTLATNVVNNGNLIKSVVLDLIASILNIVHSSSSTLNFSVLCLSLLNCYLVFKKFTQFWRLLQGKPMFDDGIPEEYDLVKEDLDNLLGFKAEAMEEVIFASAVQFMPPMIRKILSEIKNFSNRKLTDDTAFFASFLAFLHNAIMKLMAYAKMPMEWQEYIEDVLECTPISKQYDLISRSKFLLREYANNRHITYDPEFQIKTIELCHEFKKYKLKFHEVYMTNKILKELETHLVKLYKAVMAYKRAVQTEPCGYVFEGPPGGGKSILAGLLAKSFKTPIYIHCSPPASMGKDFYDTYENEHIFFQDDIGQKGVDQWSNIINFISPVPCPLMCSASELKNTKFFSSEILILTTNNLRNLGPTKTDGISDTNALYRRLYIFDTTNLKTVNGITHGTINFLSYDKELNRYVPGFSPMIVKYIKDKNLNIPSKCNGAATELILWCKSIIMMHQNVKKDLDTHDQVLEDLLKAELLDPSIVSLSEDFHFETFQLEDITKFFSYSTFQRLLQSSIKTLTSPYVLALGAAIAAGCIALATLISKPFRSEDLLGSLDSLKDEVIPSPERIKALEKYVKTCVLSISKEDKVESVLCVATVSQRMLIIPNHALNGYNADSHVLYVTVYSDHLRRTIEYDKIPVTLHASVKDVAFLLMGSKLPTMVSNIKTHFERPATDARYLITPLGIIQAPKANVWAKNYDEHEVRDDSVFYDIKSRYGLCGSIIVDENANIIGMHVAGNKIYGISQRFSTLEKQVINDILTLPTTSFGLESVPPKVDGLSVMKLQYDPLYYKVPSKTHLTPSAVCGIVPLLKKPAELLCAGPGTVKDMARKSQEPVEDVTNEALLFSVRMARTFIPQFTSLSEKQTIMGDDSLQIPSLRDDTSNGYAYSGKKEEYLDFKNGVMKSNFAEIVKRYNEQLATGKLDIKDHMSVELLKDELRLVEKVNKPRSFRMFPLHVIYQGKKWFGHLSSKIRLKRYSNGIMIGINPFAEFDSVYKRLTSMGPNIFCSDFGKWDGKMLPQLMRALNMVLLENYIGEDKEAMAQFLELIVTCPVLVMNEVYMTTHALGSGMSITALYNSMINKMMEAYFYFKICKNNSLTPTIDHFLSNIYGIYYGDDKTVAVSESFKHIYNAITVAEQATLIGLEVTTADKAPVTQPFDSQIVFLKRTFCFHRGLNRFVGKLDKISMFSTLNYVTDKNRREELTRVKVLNLQRELYLHEDLYDIFLEDLAMKLQELEFTVTFYDEQYLRFLYINDPQEYASHIDIYVDH